MAKRHETALYMQAGASNPSGIARALVQCIDEVRAEDKNPREDKACKLVLHQLAFLLGMNYMDLLTDEQYGDAMRECAVNADPSVVASCRAEMYLPGARNGAAATAN